MSPLRQSHSEPLPTLSPITKEPSGTVDNFEPGGRTSSPLSPPYLGPRALVEPNTSPSIETNTSVIIRDEPSAQNGETAFNAPMTQSSSINTTPFDFVPPLSSSKFPLSSPSLDYMAEDDTREAGRSILIPQSGPYNDRFEEATSEVDAGPVVEAAASRHVVILAEPIGDPEVGGSPALHHRHQRGRCQIM